MAHGDQRGLKLPPKVAPVQTVIVPVAVHKEGVAEKAKEIYETLKKAGVRVELDSREQSPGWKFNEWEMKGVPVRIEIGPRDIENKVAVMVRRDTHEKTTVSLDSIAETVLKTLDAVQLNMFEQSKAFTTSHIVEAKNLDELRKAVDEKNFVKAMWCGCPECEAKIKAMTAASSRVMPFDQTPIGDKCVCCGKKADKVVYFARAY